MDPSNPAVIFDTGIHPRLETGVPLLVASEGDEPMKSTWLAQKTSNAFAFKRLSFIYGLFSSLNISFGVYGFTELLINSMLVSSQGESSKSTIAEQLSDFHHVLFWIHAMIYVTYFIAMSFLNVMLIRFVFDVTTTGKKGDDAEDLDTEEEFEYIFEAYILGCLVSEVWELGF